jgi:hypothetical protein
LYILYICIVRQTARAASQPFQIQPLCPLIAHSTFPHLYNNKNWHDKTTAAVGRSFFYRANFSSLIVKQLRGDQEGLFKLVILNFIFKW